MQLHHLFDGERKVCDFGFLFYIFYKLMGADDNGILLYAKTYVPAIEVSGYVEYFKEQEKDHKSS
jgi:hypothetical protein